MIPELLSFQTTPVARYDLDIFFPDPSRTLFRNKYGIKSDEFVLLSAAADLSDKRKGMHLLWDALRMIKSKVVLMLVGNGQSIPALPDNVRVIHRGFVKDQPDNFKERKATACKQDRPVKVKKHTLIHSNSFIQN